MKPILFSLGCTETRIKWVWQGKSNWVWHAPNTTEGSSQPVALHLLERFAHSSSVKPSFSAITSWRSSFFSETIFANTFIIWDNPKGRKGDRACNCSLRAAGGMLFTAQAVRKEAQKSCGWDLLTDGTGSDSRAWDQPQPAMTLSLLFPWVTSSIS